MTTPLLATKLYVPPLRAAAVRRPRLVARLDAGLGREQGLALVSAAAGFGKTTLLAEWAASCARPVAWVALDTGDGDPARLLIYLVAALQTVAPGLGARALTALQLPQPPPPEAVLALLINELAALPAPIVLVLDDYHAVESPAADAALAFLIKHLPPTLHLVVATREDPALPLARLRAAGQLTEVRAADLRFTPDEAAAFLNQTMRLGLAAADVLALEQRTEGWIAGLQLAALSLQGRSDPATFIRSFSGSHQFVLDYLLEEVLSRQEEDVHTFLLHTSILDRLCGPLCDAVLAMDQVSGGPGKGQATLDALVRANLFVVPLDDERRWHRYHHLFAELLRQRLQQRDPGLVASLHLRASAWFEAAGLEVEAFQHAAAAGDIARAARLAEGRGMPLLFRGAVTPVRAWLASLPPAVLDQHPALWVMAASAELFVSRIVEVETKLGAAEAALGAAAHAVSPEDIADVATRDLVGHIATIRATVGVAVHDLPAIRTQAERALAFLRPDNLPVRTAANWALGNATFWQGDRAAAGAAYAEAVRTSAAIGHFIIHIMASLGLGAVQETGLDLDAAAATYRHVVELAGNPPWPVACQAHLGLAQIAYAHNDLATAEEHLRPASELAAQVVATDRAVACDLFRVQLRLAQGRQNEAADLLAQADAEVRRKGFAQRAPEVTALQVRLLLAAGDVAGAEQALAQAGLPAGLPAAAVCRARVHLARGAGAAVLALVEPLRVQAQARGWADEALRLLILEALAWQAVGELEPALARLADALALAEPPGLVRVLVDEGAPLAKLLRQAEAHGLRSGYVRRLLAAYATEPGRAEPSRAAEPAGRMPTPPGLEPLVEPLTERELEVLALVAAGLSNREIGERLYLALDTVKGHNRRIFEKLQVQRRTEAIARARALGLLGDGAA